MTHVSKYIRGTVLSMAPYSSARDEYQSRDGLFLDANENPYALSYSRYPDPYQVELKMAISKWRDIEERRIFLGNGSDEVIDLLIRATCTPGVDSVLTLDPSYGMYSVSAAVNDVKIDTVPLTSDLHVDGDTLSASIRKEHKIVFLCSPNNPNGATIPRHIIENILAISQGLVVVDEAYIDFSDQCSWSRKLSEYPNLVVMQTLSKAIGAAGIRIGIGLMDPDLVGYLNKIKPPYNISTLNQEEAIRRLETVDVINQYIKQIKTSRQRLTEELLALPEVLHVYPSEANFLLVRFTDHKEVMALLRSHHIIVRDRSSQMHCDRCLRITVGTESEIEKLLSVLTRKPLR